MKTKKILLITSTLLLIIGGIYFYKTYTKIFKDGTVKEGFIFIKSNASFKDLLTELHPFIKDTADFKWLAKKKKFFKPKSGKFFIKKGISNNQLINTLRLGKQTPVNVAFNNQNTLNDLANRISEQLEPDKNAFLKAMTDENFLKKNGFTLEDALSMYVPNSYQIYWNTTPEKFRERMLKEYKKFWNNSRKAKAKKIGLTPKEVTTLASIVHKETAKKSERPIVAGLYLNRLRDKWPLQADPTIIFAMKKKYGQDFDIKRVLYKNIEDVKDSPYNTYKKQGLPPAPIAMPDISAIDAVLNPKIHDYYYMCASVHKIGYHEFAKTLNQHNLNKKKYTDKKDRQGIKQ